MSGYYDTDLPSKYGRNPRSTPKRPSAFSLTANSIQTPQKPTGPSLVYISSESITARPYVDAEYRGEGITGSKLRQMQQDKSQARTWDVSANSSLPSNTQSIQANTSYKYSRNFRTPNKPSGKGYISSSSTASISNKPVPGSMSSAHSQQEELEQLEEYVDPLRSAIDQKKQSELSHCLVVYGEYKETAEQVEQGSQKCMVSEDAVLVCSQQITRCQQDWDELPYSASSAPAHADSVQLSVFTRVLSSSPSDDRAMIDGRVQGLPVVFTMTPPPVTAALLVGLQAPALMLPMLHQSAASVYDTFRALLYAVHYPSICSLVLHYFLRQLINSIGDSRFSSLNDAYTPSSFLSPASKTALSMILQNLPLTAVSSLTYNLACIAGVKQDVIFTHAMHTLLPTNPEQITISVPYVWKQHLSQHIHIYKDYLMQQQYNAPSHKASKSSTLTLTTRQLSTLQNTVPTDHIQIPLCTLVDTDLPVIIPPHWVHSPQHFSVLANVFKVNKHVKLYIPVETGHIDPLFFLNLPLCTGISLNCTADMFQPGQSSGKTYAHNFFPSSNFPIMLQTKHRAGNNNQYNCSVAADSIQSLQAQLVLHECLACVMRMTYINEEAVNVSLEPQQADIQQRLEQIKVTRQTQAASTLVITQNSTYKQCRVEIQFDCSCASYSAYNETMQTLIDSLCEGMRVHRAAIYSYHSCQLINSKLLGTTYTTFLKDFEATLLKKTLQGEQSRLDSALIHMFSPLQPVVMRTQQGTKVPAEIARQFLTSFVSSDFLVSNVMHLSMTYLNLGHINIVCKDTDIYSFFTCLPSLLHLNIQNTGLHADSAQLVSQLALLQGRKSKFSSVGRFHCMLLTHQNISSCVCIAENTPSVVLDLLAAVSALLQLEIGDSYLKTLILQHIPLSPASLGTLATGLVRSRQQVLSLHHCRVQYPQFVRPNNSSSSLFHENIPSIADLEEAFLAFAFAVQSSHLRALHINEMELSAGFLVLLCSACSQATYLQQLLLPGNSTESRSVKAVTTLLLQRHNEGRPLQALHLGPEAVMYQNNASPLEPYCPIFTCSNIDFVKSANKTKIPLHLLTPLVQACVSTQIEQFLYTETSMLTQNYLEPFLDGNLSAHQFLQCALAGDQKVYIPPYINTLSNPTSFVHIDKQLGVSVDYLSVVEVGTQKTKFPNLANIQKELVLAHRTTERNSSKLAVSDTSVYCKQHPSLQEKFASLQKQSNSDSNMIRIFRHLSPSLFPSSATCCSQCFVRVEAWQELLQRLSECSFAEYLREELVIIDAIKASIDKVNTGSDMLNEVYDVILRSFHSSVGFLREHRVITEAEVNVCLAQLSLVYPGMPGHINEWNSFQDGGDMGKLRHHTWKLFSECVKVKHGSEQNAVDAMQMFTDSENKRQCTLPQHMFLPWSMQVSCDQCEQLQSAGMSYLVPYHTASQFIQAHKSHYKTIPASAQTKNVCYRQLGGVWRYFGSTIQQSKQHGLCEGRCDDKDCDNDGCVCSYNSQPSTQVLAAVQKTNKTDIYTSISYLHNMQSVGIEKWTKWVVGDKEKSLSGEPILAITTTSTSTLYAATADLSSWPDIPGQEYA